MSFTAKELGSFINKGIARENALLRAQVKKMSDGTARTAKAPRAAKTSGRSKRTKSDKAGSDQLVNV